MSKLTLIERDALKAITEGATAEAWHSEIRTLEKQGLVATMVYPTQRGLRVMKKEVSFPVALKTEVIAKIMGWLSHEANPDR